MTSDDKTAAEKPSKPENFRRHVLTYGRLEPQTEWTGGRITDTDLLTLDEAAAMATRHSGEQVSPNDFLRAGGRGEIRLLAIVRRSAVMRPVRPSDGPLEVPYMCIPLLPLHACQQLAASGHARWRTLEDVERDPEPIGFTYQFPRWELPEGEPDFETVLADCRVKGYDTHALADAFKVPDSDVAHDSAQAKQQSEPSHPDRGRRVKREALIADNVRRWSTIERDLRDAAKNGLAEQAKDSVKGWWWEGSAQEWARVRAKLRDTPPLPSFPFATSERPRR